MITMSSGEMLTRQKLSHYPINLTYIVSCWEACWLVLFSSLSSLLFSSLCFPNWMWCRYVDLNKVRHNSEIKIKIFTAAQWEVRSEGTLRDPGPPPPYFVKNRRTDKIPKNRTFWTQKRRSFRFFSLKMQNTSVKKENTPHSPWVWNIRWHGSNSNRHVCGDDSTATLSDRIKYNWADSSPIIGIN